ncbi:HAMP domain-containing sensor histidine kinase [uncultured Chryseobacterium sp.]|uniref:sensor histidine kinase n=1 Tax=uncultured Chryseobacterium sp. TaxID=259322 RepID=UPI0025F7EBF5|nr:HAMP domain-containing sensor histidine kinase [uncultured Chryseobacterium sp.]
MNRKKSITVILFSFSLIILVALQAYYIYNSYRLEEKDYNRQAKEIAEKVMDGMDKFDTETHDSGLVGDFERLKLGMSIQNEKIFFPDKFYSSESQYSKKMESLLKKHIGNSGFKMAMKNEIYSVMDELKSKEILPKGHSIIIFQSVNKVEKPITLSNSIWSSRQSETDTNLNIDKRYKYLVKSQASYQLLNIETLILKKIIPLVIISLLIVILIIILFRNSIRNLNRQEQKIAQLHTTIDSIAHELNTPITTLKFSIARSSDPESRALLERQIRRLENIVASIHTRDAEDVLLDKKNLEEYFAEVKKQHNTIRFNIRIELSENKRLAQNDFRQMMDNLIDNSAKYGADEIEIDVTINKITELKISDNGIGIPDEEHRNIFEKYYRISREANKHTNGLGVGLFLVKRMVDKYRGHIEVKSQEKGVSFKITIPDEA